MVFSFARRISVLVDGACWSKASRRRSPRARVRAVYLGETAMADFYPWRICPQATAAPSALRRGLPPGRGQALAVLAATASQDDPLDTLVGVTRRFTGSIALGGPRSVALAPEVRAVLGVGWVPQERNIFRSLSVQENITAVARPGPWSIERVFGLSAPERARPAIRRIAVRRRAADAGDRPRARDQHRAWLLLDRDHEGWRRSSCRSCWLGADSLASRRELAAIIVEQHAQKILPITDRALILERGRSVHQSDSAALMPIQAPLERFLGVTAGNDLRKFRNFRKYVYSAPALSQHAGNGARRNNAPRCGGNNNHRMGAWRRRRVLGD